MSRLVSTTNIATTSHHHHHHHHHHHTIRNLLLLNSQIVWILLVFLAMIEGVSGIGCFVCTSFNQGNPECEDPFNSTSELLLRDRGETSTSVANYKHPCWAHKKGRNGLFPADHCIKIIGFRTENPSQTVVIRTCALDSGTLTADTEIVRISHCGSFKYDSFQYKGCVQSCDTDGCNSTPSRLLNTHLLLLSILIFTLITIFQ